MTRFLLITFFIFAPFKAIALIEVDITRGNLSPLPIAVSPLSIDENSRKNFEKILKQKNIASEISSIIMENCFEYLDAPVIRVASLDTPIPFEKGLEDQYLPYDRFEIELNKLLNY